MSLTTKTREELLAEPASWRARLSAKKLRPNVVGDQAIVLLPAVVALLDDSNPAHHLIVEHFRTRRNTQLPIIRLDAAHTLLSAHNALLSFPVEVRHDVALWAAGRRNLDQMVRLDPRGDFDSLRRAPKLLDQAIGCFHLELPTEMVNRFITHPRPTRRGHPGQFPLWEASVVSQLLDIDRVLCRAVAEAA